MPSQNLRTYPIFIVMKNRFHEWLEEGNFVAVDENLSDLAVDDETDRLRELDDHG